MTIEQLFEHMGTDEVCLGCGEEITVSSDADPGQIEVECPCGCSLAVA